VEVKLISITEKTIDVNKLFRDVSDQSSGASVLFTGTVRDHNVLGKVSQLHYEAYQEMAEKVLQEIEIEIHKKWKVNRFIAIHRTGTLKVGEVSVTVAVFFELFGLCLLVFYVYNSELSRQFLHQTFLLSTIP